MKLLLTEKEMQVLELRALGLTYEEVGKRLAKLRGIKPLNRERVRQLEARATRKVVEEMRRRRESGQVPSSRRKGV